MRILVVSGGLKPDHFGGLPSHVEDVIRGLAGRGVDVGYLNTGKKSRFPRTALRPRRDLGCPAWDLASKRAFTQYWTGTLEPMRQVAPSHVYARRFTKLIESFRPGLVHFHELTSFPIALMHELKRRGIKVIYSAADFYPLCPTVKLLRPDGTICERAAGELDCDLCSKQARYNVEMRFEHAVDQWLPTMIGFRNVGRRIIRFAARVAGRRAPRAEYQERRRAFERSLAACDRVLVTSREQSEVFANRVPHPLNLHFLQRSRATIRPRGIVPRTDTVRPNRLTFLALNIVNAAKGLTLLEDAFSELSRTFPNVWLHLYGLEPGAGAGMRRFGPYDESQLDDIVAHADFGIIPSIWKEAFGYVGPEMLSRGLPVVASNTGGMRDYVVDGVNGLLFDPTAPRALENTIRTLIADPILRHRLWDGAANGPRHYLTMDEHLDRLTTLYEQVLSEATPTSAATT
jgi:glycosyltransferase involved in cell wall biosynthesis